MKDYITAIVLAAMMLTLCTCQAQPARATALPVTQAGGPASSEWFDGALRPLAERP